MAYTAKVNGVTFFKTDSDDPALALTEAKVKLGAGSAGTFDFVIPRSNSKFNQLTRYRSFVDVYRDGEEESLFSGRVVTIGSGFDTFEKISCEGALTYLSDSYFRPITHDGMLYPLIEAIMDSHNSQVEADKQIRIGTIEIPNSNCYREYEKIETCLTRLKDLNESFGGYILIRKAADGLLYLDWHRYYDDANPQAIKLGSNLINISIEDSNTDICTVLIPYGAQDEDGNYTTIKSVNNDRDYIVADQQYLDQYGYITKVEHFDDVTVPANLLTKARANLLARLTKKITIVANAVDLADTNEVGVEYFSIGQLLKVKSYIHGVDEFFECTDQDLDLLHPENNTLTLGGTKTNYIQAHSEGSTSILIERLTKKYMTKSLMEAAIDNATEKITGNQGGHIRLYDSNNDGDPDELLCMDTASIETAVKLWRLNNSGFGYSNHGYNGPYALAMTMDGAIVADRITTGTLNANVIRAGIITSPNGGAYWNLDTGEMNILAGSVQGLSPVATSGNYSDLNGTPSLQGYVQTDGTIGSTPSSGSTGFVVSSAGLLQASNAVIFGTIYASAGTIGGLKIETNSIHSNGYAITNNATGSIGLSSVDFTRTLTTSYNSYGSGVDESVSGLRFALGSRFGIDKYGNVYGTSAKLASLHACDWVIQFDRIGTKTLVGSTSAGTKEVYMYNANGGSGALFMGRYWSSSSAYKYVSITSTAGIDSNSDWYTTGSCAAASFPHASDRRLKENIETLDEDESSNFIYALNPVRYSFKHQQGVIRHGFIAQDIEDLLAYIDEEDWGIVTEHVENDLDGNYIRTIKQLSYTELIADMVVTIQSLNKRLRALESIA